MPVRETDAFSISLNIVYTVSNGFMVRFMQTGFHHGTVDIVYNDATGGSDI